MIDPTTITKFDRTESELEEFLLFCVLVAGKDSKVQAKKLEQFLHRDVFHSSSPLSQIKSLVEFTKYDLLMSWIKDCKLGQYRRIYKCFKELLTLHGKLSFCSVLDLEAISGIGPKTARFFLTHTRPNQQFAVLDTHMLHYLRDQGFSGIPKTTPNGKTYQRCETLVLACAKEAAISPADFDLMVWNKYSKNGNNHLDK